MNNTEYYKKLQLQIAKLEALKSQGIPVAQGTDMLTLSDERVSQAIRENNAKLCVFDPLQAFLGANVDMNRANEVRPILSRLGKVAEQTGCAIVFIGHLNKAASIPGIQSDRGLSTQKIIQQFIYPVN